jgi:hypothetical protein
MVQWDHCLAAVVMVVLVDQVVVVEDGAPELVDQVILLPLVHLKEIMGVQDINFLLAITQHLTVVVEVEVPVV